MRERRRTRWLIILAGCTVLALLSASRIKVGYSYSNHAISWGDALALGLVEWYPWAALAPIIDWLVRRFPIAPRAWWRALLAHVPGGLVISVVEMMIELRGRRLILEQPAAGNVTVFQLYSTLLTYGAFTGVLYAADHYRKYRMHELRGSQLAAQLVEARLQALTMQLNPHFLFNTLHAISSLVHRDVEAADRMIARLGDLLRLTLDSGDAQEVTLRQELGVLERYLDIERIRFPDRLAVRLAIDPATLDAQVPSLILQPLVENAIRHGLAVRSAPGHLEIRSAREDGMLRLEVSDDGVGLPDDAAQPIQEGIGLANTRARLRQLYGADHRLELHGGAQGGMVASLVFPFRPFRAGGPAS